MEYGGDGGIRTLDRALQPYNGLANRRLQPLGHISGTVHHMPDARADGKAPGAVQPGLPHSSRLGARDEVGDPHDRRVIGKQGRMALAFNDIGLAIAVTARHFDESFL
jgi:hypothetical protein